MHSIEFVAESPSIEIMAKAATIPRE